MYVSFVFLGGMRRTGVGGRGGIAMTSNGMRGVHVLIQLDWTPPVVAVITNACHVLATSHPIHHIDWGSFQARGTWSTWVRVFTEKGHAQ
jgi:hypothetical protein